MKYVRNYHRIIAVDLTRQKELDVDPKAIQQIEFVGKLKNPDNAVVDDESMFVLMITETKKRDYSNIT